jgi:diguanylate cyclase (GGDEF)-like protein
MHQERDARIAQLEKRRERFRAGSGHGLVEARSGHSESHDELTGLTNRRHLADAAKSGSGGAGRSVVVIDLDGFNAVNNAYGHGIGDEVLRVVAERLREVVTHHDWLVRLGGDEFAIFVPTTDLTVSRDLGERARAAIVSPISVGGVVVFVDCSVGIAAGGEDESVSRVMSRAEACMYEVKSSGSARRVVTFDPKVHGAVMDTLTLSADLRGAVQRRELVLHYQPIVDMVSRRTVGFEALVRWVHPERGVITPLTFIPVAEQIGLMPELGAWVLREACRQAAVLRAQFKQAPYVSVNLSIRQLEEPDFLERFRAALERERMVPGQLVVEVTESVLATNLDVLVGPLEALRRIGARVYLDDFGTGYSSLGYVRELPLDGVKLDRVFIQDLTTSDDAWAIARAVVALLTKLGLSLTAEGIESAAHLAQLRSLGCGQGQGYYFGRPLPASATSASSRGITVTA